MQKPPATAEPRPMPKSILKNGSASVVAVAPSPSPDSKQQSGRNRMSRWYRAQIHDDQRPLIAEIVVDEKQAGFGSMSVECALDSTTQHKLAWHHAIELPLTVNGRPAVLPPGHCNLYHYPKTYFAHLRKGKGVVPEPEQHFVLEELVRALILAADDEPSAPSRASIANVHDGSGATPLHALCVANTNASTGLVVDLCQKAPHLLLQAHTSKLFLGENLLHILAVNQREAEIIALVEIAAASLTAFEARQLFWAQASGFFFTVEPMLYYGGTPIGYAVAFSLKGALRAMLHAAKKHPSMSGVVDFNNPQAACRLTGFLPVHVAVANSLTSMLNFLLDLPGLEIEYDDMRARGDSVSQLGRQTARFSLLLPIQLAVKMADKKMVQYILRTQSYQRWQWGPVSEYHLNLHGIDSVGESGQDVMEIVARLDASVEVQEMLLDSFMDGLLHKLFVQKLARARLLNLAMQLLDLIYLFAVYALALWLKQNPEQVLYTNGAEGASPIPQLLPYVALIVMAPLIAEDLRATMVWFCSAHAASPEQQSAGLQSTKLRMKQDDVATRLLLFGRMKGRDAWMAMRWMHSHSMWEKFAGMGCGAFACLYLLVLRTREVDDLRWDASQVSARDRTDLLLVPLSVSIILYSNACLTTVLSAYERLGIFYKTVFKMLKSDVLPWALLFFLFLLNYGMQLYISYPRFTDAPPSFNDTISGELGTLVEPAPQFTSFWSAISATIQLALMGEPLDFDITEWRVVDTQRSTIKAVNFTAFVCFYVIFIVMSLILLLNLLIAMMGDTYERAQRRSTLEWRVDFARRVLRLEMQLRVFERLGLVTLHSGQRVISQDGSPMWVWAFKTYQPNAEGGGTRGGKRSMFEAEIEEEADQDELDDDGPGAGDTTAKRPLESSTSDLQEDPEVETISADL